MAATYDASTAPASTSRRPGLVDRGVPVRGRAAQDDRARRSRTSTSDAVRRRLGHAAASAPAEVCVDQLDDLVVPRAAHEVVDGHVDRRRRLLLGPVGQVLVGDHQVVGVGQVGDRLVDHGDLAVAGGLDLLAQHRGAHRRGAHAGVAGEHDRPDLLARGAGSRRRAPATRGLLALHRLHARPWRPPGHPRPAVLSSLSRIAATVKRDRGREDHRQGDADQAAAPGPAATRR